MDIAKRTIKEQRIVDAAEKVFSTYGFKNTKMEEIAKEAGITKVTLYSYFQSKENLYLSITYRAFNLLIKAYEAIVEEYKEQPGIESAITMMEAFMDFCENNYLYSEAFLEYFAIIRSTSDGENTSKLTDAMQESLYFQKMQDIQFIPLKISSEQIQRGQKDGSIVNKQDPLFLSLHGWAMIIGHAKIMAASGSSSFFNIDLADMKRYNLKVGRMVLMSN